MQLTVALLANIEVVPILTLILLLLQHTMLVRRRFIYVALVFRVRRLLFLEHYTKLRCCLLFQDLSVLFLLQVCNLPLFGQLKDLVLKDWIHLTDQLKIAPC